jgi:hypothetical protein
MYVGLIGAEALRFADGSRVVDEATYLAWQLLQMDPAYVRRSLSDTPIPAVVNWGSWIVRCPCGAGAKTAPTIRIACCTECGTVHRRVTFPADVDAIAAALLARPTRPTQNWEPHETIADLVRENEAHCV